MSFVVHEHGPVDRHVKTTTREQSQVYRYMQDRPSPESLFFRVSSSVRFSLLLIRGGAMPSLRIAEVGRPSLAY